MVWGRVWSAGAILRGSWVVISGGISRVTIHITHVSGLVTPLITPHEPPSKGLLVRSAGFGVEFRTSGSINMG